jgi:hypothetical protein
LIEFKVREMRNRLELIRRDVEGDGVVLKRVLEIEKAIKTLVDSGGDNKVVFHRLWIYEQDYVNDLYQKVVVRKSQQGLLRGAPQ